MAVNKLRYNFSESEDSTAVEGCEQSFYVSQSLDRGVNASGVLNFSFPADPDCFTDTGATYMAIKLRVLRADGTHLDSTDKVLLGSPGMATLFKSCVVSLNGTALPPSNLYPYSARLVQLLGTPSRAQNGFWANMEMAGNDFGIDLLTQHSADYLLVQMAEVAGSKEVILYGRLFSDFMLTCAQLLPPGMKVDVSLTRSADSFTLCAPPPAEGSPATDYKVELESVTMYLKRMELGPKTLALTKESLLGGGKLRYNRLSADVQQIPSGSLVYRWNNIYNGGPLPHTVYVLLVKQVAFYGNLRALPVYLGSGHLRSFRLLNNGRDVLPEPYVFNLRYTSADMDTPDIRTSDAKAAIFGLGRVLGLANASSTPVVLDSQMFLAGSCILAAKLNTCGGRRVQPGSLDLELQFTAANDDPDQRLMCLCFGEFDHTLSFSSNLNLF